MISLFFKKKRMTKPVVLLILDGWGLAPPSPGNAISQAKTPNMDNFPKYYPHGELIASGESVGLPAGEVGNSEVGHLAIGVGRVIYQSLKRINMSIEDGSFYDNKAFVSAAQHVSQNKSKLHIMGLIGSGNVHSSTPHLYALLQFCKKQEIKDVYLHLFTDGRDAAPNDGINVIAEIEKKIKLLSVGQIVSISGRYWAMDRDGRWARTKTVYDTITLGSDRTAASAIEILKSSYATGKTDEFVEPTSVVDTTGRKITVDDGDALIFLNFRSDRARQLSMSFTMPNFETIQVADFGFQEGDDNYNKQDKVFEPTFQRKKKINNLFFVAMAQYQENIPFSAVAFLPQVNFPDSLSDIFSKKGFKQLHLAESEKERMVTYYFDGMRAQRFPGEDVAIIPSPKVPTYDKKPEMSVFKIVSEFKKALKKDTYQFIVMNFANPDMVAHSGKISAAIKALEHVDRAIGMVVNETLKADGVVVISADHGNAEELITYPSSTFFYTTNKGEVNTDHSSNPVPLYIIGNRFYGQGNNIVSGTLADIAPTILGIMNIETPEAIKGKNLL
ncbi:2,3-bisphosphoglycerate-independent phosphoglycerate mutase [Candidatus Microgenomates bacterium]|nr:MAG: 2,3-bisphosphoglycerate-independent phosphoglycerate mutase [Candidatus Microgenomates bacterium]